MGPGTKTVSGVLAVLSMFALALDARGDGGPIVFQSTETPPCWSSVMPSGGMGGEILRLLSDAAGLGYSINYLPIARFRASRAPYIVGDPGILTTDRSRAIFPIGVFHSAYVYYQPRHPELTIHSMKDLSGHTIGVMRGTLENMSLFAQHRIKVEESDSTESLMRMLRKGRIDVAVLVDLAGQHLVREMFPNEQDDFVQIVIRGSARPLAVMVDLDAPDGHVIARRYRQVLKITIQSHEYEGILRKYYGTGVEIGKARETVDRLVEFYASSWGNRDEEP